MKSRKFLKEGQRWELPDTFHRVSIKLIIKNANDQLLVLKELSTNSWELPGGGLDHGESILQTAEREIREELDVELTHLNDQPVGLETSLHRDDYYVVKIYFKGTLSDHNFTLEPGFEFKFVDQDEFLALKMESDESPIQAHPDRIWN